MRPRPALGALAIIASSAVAWAGTDPSSPAAPPPSPVVATPETIAGLQVLDDGDAELPVTVVDATGTEVTVTSTQRIVPANGDLAEIVFALGLGGNVVARDVSATFPPEVEAVPSVGYQRTLPLEPLAAFEPTVVVATTTAGPPETISGLRDLGIPVVVLDVPDNLEGPPDKLRALGAVLGVAEEAEAMAAQVEEDISAATELADQAGHPPRVAALYLRGKATQVMFGPGSGMSVLLDAAGAEDLGATLGIDETQPVNLEALLAAAPEALVVTDSGLASVGGVEGLLALGGGALARTPAGKDRRVLAYDDQLLLGFGPRTGDALDRLVTDLHGDAKGSDA